MRSLSWPSVNRRRVPHEVGAVAQRGERSAFGGDRFDQADAVLAERVAAARLAVAADQRLVVGVEEEHVGRDAVAFEASIAPTASPNGPSVRTSSASAALA